MELAPEEGTLAQREGKVGKGPHHIRGGYDKQRERDAGHKCRRHQRAARQN